MENFIKWLGGFVSADQLAKFEFVSSKAEREAVAAREAAAEKWESGAGFAAWRVSELAA
jgi:hypothetical protein